MKINKEDTKYIYYLAGKNLKKIRKKHGYTQVGLADLVNASEGTIANIENDSYQTFSLEYIYIIAKALNEDIRDFFIPLDDKKQ